MLEKLRDKYIGERTTLEKEEMNAGHALEMLMRDLQAQIQQAMHSPLRPFLVHTDEKMERGDGTKALVSVSTNCQDKQAVGPKVHLYCQQSDPDQDQRIDLQLTDKWAPQI